MFPLCNTIKVNAEKLRHVGKGDKKKIRSRDQSAKSVTCITLLGPLTFDG
jgi:hypothetical protein